MSTLTAFDFIQERSEATPGLWNRAWSQLSANIRAVGEGPFLSTSTDTLSFQTNLNISGNLGVAGRGLFGAVPSVQTTGTVTISVPSSTSDYIHFEDTSGTRSDYLLGSRVGGTADGLNLWDLSGNTMLVSFSKQSIRFYQNVVGPVFDVGGALADTYNAATFGTGALSVESRIQAAISQASIDSIARVYVPANMYPYSAGSVSFETGVQMVREGGRWDVYDVKAYGAQGSGTSDDVAAFNAAIRHLKGRGGVVYVPAGDYSISSTIDMRFGTTGVPTVQLVGEGIVATRLASTVTTGPGILVGDSNNDRNTIIGLDIFQSALALPSLRVGNFGIRHTGQDSNGITLRDLRVRYWGDVGIQLEGGHGPILLQSIEVQSIATWGIFLSKEPGTAAQDVQILSGNLQHCRGGLRLRGAKATSVIGLDIELSDKATLPAVQLEESARGNSFLGITASVGAAPVPAGVVYIVSGRGNTFVGGLFVTTVAGVNNVLLDSGNASWNAFIQGNYDNVTPGGLSYASVVDGSRNLFITPRLETFTSGQAAVFDNNNSNIAIGVPSRIASNDLGMGSPFFYAPAGSAIAPPFSFGSSEASLGWYRSAASTMALSYGSIVIGTDPGGAHAIRTSGSINASGTITAGSTLIGTGIVRATGASAVLQADNRAAAGTNIWQLYNASGADIRFFQGADRIVVSTTEVEPGTTGAMALGRPGARWGNSYLSRMFANDGSAINPTHAFSSESSLGFYRSGISTIAPSYGTFNLATNSVRLSMRTAASLDSTNLAVDEVAFTVIASGASLGIRSGSTIYYFTSSASTKA